MKIAILSDIHGNIAALDAVLADAQSRRVDGLVNLGDICSGPLFPCETADRLMALGLPTISGNHERQVLSQSQDAMGLSDRHAARSLRPDQMAWLASLPKTLQLTPEVLMVHGTPDSDLQYFLETVGPEGLRRATGDEIVARAGKAGASVILCGHTHLARAVRLADGRLIVNPGSVGLPAYADDRPYPHIVETGSPHARYAILSGDGANWSAELMAVEYDWARAALEARTNGRPDWERALLTGRV